MHISSSFLRNSVSLLVLLSSVCPASAMLPAQAEPPADDRSVAPARPMATEEEIDSFVESWLSGVTQEYAERFSTVSPFYKQRHEEGKTPQMAVYLDYKNLLLTLIRQPQTAFSRTWDAQKADVYSFFELLVKGQTHAANSGVDMLPVLGYFSRHFYNPLFKKLNKMGAVKAEETFNLVPAGEHEFFGFFRHKNDYHMCAIDNRDPYYLYSPYPERAYNGSVKHIVQPAVLVNNNAVVSLPGYLVSVSKMMSQVLHVRTYHGTQNSDPDLFFRENANATGVQEGAKLYHTLKKMLEEQRQRQEDKTDPRVFIPTDIAPEDAPYVSYLLLEALEGEVDSQVPEMQQFLGDAYAEGMAGLLTDETGAGPVEEDRPRLSLAELRAQLERDTLEALVQAEQQAISRKVVAGQVQGRPKHSQSKRLSRAQKAKKTLEKKADRTPIAEAATASAVDMQAEVREKVRKLFEENLNGVRTKYKSLLHLLTKARSEIMKAYSVAGRVSPEVRSTTKGSHMSVHDSQGVETLARKASVSTRVARSFLERMIDGLLASLEGPRDRPF